MIFVALGTQDKSFTRLLETIERQIEMGNIKDKVIVQAGYTKFISDKMEIFDYISMSEFEKNIDKCDLFITHGGVGNILTALQKGKKIIAAPRLAKYKEHTNDHQIQIVNSMAEGGYLLKFDEQANMTEVLEKAKTFKPKKWHSNTDKFNHKLLEYINGN